MPGLKEVRLRVKAVKGIQQVTKAMKMVATVKLKRIQAQLGNARPYVDTLFALAQRLAAASAGEGEPLHPLLATPGDGQELIVVIGSDRGLCGGFNTGLFRHVLGQVRDTNPAVVVVGRKTKDFFARQRFAVELSYERLAFPMPWADAEKMANEILAHYTFRKHGRVRLAYQRFLRPGVSKPVLADWIPFTTPGATAAGGGSGELKCEPSIGAVLDLVLPRALTARLHRALLESQASEQGARMMAMDSATTNASDLQRDLTLLGNKLRQSGITNELLEITTGAEALKN